MCWVNTWHRVVRGLGGRASDARGRADKSRIPVVVARGPNEGATAAAAEASRTESNTTHPFRVQTWWLLLLGVGEVNHQKVD